MLPPIILNPQDNDKILDMTAAPGSKTTMLAQMMHNNGLIIANDISRNRTGSIINNIERMGIINAVVTNIAGQKIGYLTPAYFDKVLLDAPCSLEGTIRNTPQALKQWTESKIKRLSKLQKGLINSAFKCLKSGGTLVYSTCTFAPEENEEVIDYLFRKYPNVTCETMALANIKTRPPILQWQNNGYHEQIKNAIRIYPQDNDTEGFFIAKVRKL
jgi:NOL1/NOP2/sun family putative RNA methylase